MDEQLTRRWRHEPCEGAPGTYEVLTDDGACLHVCYISGEAMAQHLVELHNRTMGDGQDPPPLVDSTDARRWAREFMQLSATTEMDEGAMLSWFANALETGRRAGQRERRQLPHTLVHVDVRQRVMEMVEDLVQERVTAYAAREPARLVIDGNPVAMANVLSKLGYVVFEDQASYRRELLAELGRWPVVVGLDSDIVRMVDVLRKRGYTVFAPDHVFEGTPTAGAPVDTEVAQKVSPE